MSVNKVILVGNVGNEPVIKEINGNKLTTFSLATSESYKKDGQRVTNTEWHNIEVWRGLAEIVEKYVNKGTQLYIEGKIKTDSYEKDGNKRYVTKIICSHMVMLGGGKKDDNKNTPDNTITENTQPESNTTEEQTDLPF